MAENQFWTEYSNLKRRFPRAVSYLDKQLTPHASLWANFSLDTFTANSFTTQRGEGLNRAVKAKLDGRSSLVKVFDNITNRETWEDARTMCAQGRGEVNFRDMGSTASQLFPEIYNMCKKELTSYGLKLILHLVHVSQTYVTMGLDGDAARHEYDLHFPDNNDANGSISDLTPCLDTYVTHISSFCQAKLPARIATRAIFAPVGAALEQAYLVATSGLYFFTPRGPPSTWAW